MDLDTHCYYHLRRYIRVKLRKNKHAVLFLFIIDRRGLTSAWLGSQEVWGWGNTNCLISPLQVLLASVACVLFQPLLCRTPTWFYSNEIWQHLPHASHPLPQSFPLDTGAHKTLGRHLSHAWTTRGIYEIMRWVGQSSDRQNQEAKGMSVALSHQPMEHPETLYATLENGSIRLNNGVAWELTGGRHLRTEPAFWPMLSSVSLYPSLTPASLRLHTNRVTARKVKTHTVGVVLCRDIGQREVGHERGRN